MIVMNYEFAQDLLAIRKVLGLTQKELAVELGVERITISRNERGKTQPSEKLMETVYAYAFKNNIQFNRLKEMLWYETLPHNHRLLFHGAKTAITGPLRINAGRSNNDFGSGFYTGERYEQAVSFISGFEKSSVYMLDFNPQNLKCRRYEVDQEWMMTIAYYRGALTHYQNHPVIKKLIHDSRDCDYIIAPIADNRMFQIINSFIDGEITDEQCKHCLAATNLGSQYIFISERAIKQVILLERCYLAKNEKDHYKNIRISDTKLGDDKVKLARIKYRGQGRYIDEILI